MKPATFTTHPDRPTVDRRTVISPAMYEAILQAGADGGSVEIPVNGNTMRMIHTLRARFGYHKLSVHIRRQPGALRVWADAKEAK